ncbi:MAG: peptidoglycan DD-metalloendopeptidase family protein [gamma proteobacterium symbiont of Taylorina sp.]|nr:peptidoglycan DD-metalloendopeptidase family protein [gamma proteobacterium symbiont of Taylorina sp.]
MNINTKVNKVYTFFFLVVVISAAIVASGCTSTYAPVEQRNAAKSKDTRKYSGKTPKYYTIKKGDTLFSIAWLYGLDYKTIAKRNNIIKPYRIYVGKKIRLTGSAAKSKVKNTRTVSNKKKTVRYTGKTKKTIKKSTIAKSHVKIIHKVKSSTKLNWVWPVKGKIIQQYSPKRGKKGIDISAAQGTLIKSSEAGKVVYSGQGLVGYGRMLIIKHNETYLSAYAHNQNLMVTEGESVKKGQNIARLGRSGTDRFKLHFEIRKNGKPVNPMSYLPR